MKPRKTLSVYVLLVGVMGLSIVGGILAFQIFSASIKYQLTEEIKAAVKPIDGSISQTVINNLQQRRVITEAEMASLPAPILTTVLVTTPPEASPTGELTSQTATPSGEVAPTQ